MEIIGKLRQLLPEQRGESARGAWVRGGFVIDVNTESQFPRSIAFSTWGEDILNQLKSLHIGATIQVIFDIESRQWQDRWFTDCRCRSIGTFVSGNNSSNNNDPYNNNGNYQNNNMGTYQNEQAQQSVDYQRPNNEVHNVEMQPTQPKPTIENDSMEAEDNDDLPF